GPGLGVVAQPVGAVATVGAFDGDLHRVVGVRRTGQRIAASHRTGPVTGDAQGQELAWAVYEAGAVFLGNLEHQRPGVGALVDDRGHREAHGARAAADFGVDHDAGLSFR